MWNTVLGSRARDFVTQNRMLLESDPVLLSRVHPMRRRLSPFARSLLELNAQNYLLDNEEFREITPAVAAALQARELAISQAQGQITRLNNLEVERVIVHHERSTRRGTQVYETEEARGLNQAERAERRAYQNQIAEAEANFRQEFPYIQTRNLPDWSDPADRNNFDLEAYRNAYDYEDNGSVSLSPTFNELMHGTLDEGDEPGLGIPGYGQLETDMERVLSDFRHRLRNNRAGWLVDPIEAIATHFEIPPAEIGRFFTEDEMETIRGKYEEEILPGRVLSNVGTALMSKWRQLIRNIRPQAALRVPDERSTSAERRDDDFRNALFLMVVWEASSQLIQYMSATSSINLSQTLTAAPFSNLPFRTTLPLAMRKERVLEIINRRFLADDIANGTLTLERVHQVMNNTFHTTMSTKSPIHTYFIPWQSILALRAINQPVVLAQTIQTLLRMAHGEVNAGEPAFSVQLTLEVSTRRQFTDEQGGWHYNWITHVVPAQSSPLIFNIDDSIRDIAEPITRAVMHIMLGERENSHDVRQSDQVLVTAATFTYVRDPRGHEPLPGANQLVRQHFIELMHHLRAYAVPDLYHEKWFSKVVVRQPFLTDERVCITESFLYLQMRKEGFTDPQMIRTMMQQALTPELLAKSIELNGRLYDTLEHNFKCTSSWRMREDGFYLCFFPGFAKCGANSKVLQAPEMPCVYLWCVSDHMQLDTPDESPFFNLPMDELVMVYGNGHVWISTYGSYLSLVQGPHSLEERIQETVRREVPEPFELKPILLQPVRESRARKFNPLSAPVDGKDKVKRITGYSGEFNARANMDFLSVDFETSTCPVCHCEEVFAAAIVGDGWGLSFLGQECLKVAKDYTFHNFTGSLTQMLRFIKTNCGWSDKRGAMSKNKMFAVQKVFVTMNGSRFDHWFALRSLRYWNEPYDIIEIGGGLARLGWGSSAFIDLCNIYKTSLDGLYQNFSSSVQPPGLNLPPTPKWKCFPYDIIQESMLDPQAHLIDLERDSIWGGKKADPSNPEPIGVQNARWWREHIGPYYCAQEHLGAYCLDDVWVLQYLVCYHQRVLSRGVVNGRLTDRGHCFTRSQAAIMLFQQAYLTETIVSPDMSMPTGFARPGGEGEFNIDELIRMAYKGGRVVVFRHRADLPSEKPLRDAYIARTGKLPTVDLYDRNSSYPHCMTEDMPVKLQEIKLYWDTPFVLQREDLKECDFYCCSIDFPDTKGCVMIKFNGYCLTVDHTPYMFYDPKLKEWRYNMVTGKELRTALREGAVITVYAVLCFEAKPIFRQFMEDLYARRAASTDEAVRMDLKNDMNSVYGKTAQEVHAKMIPINSSIDLTNFKGQNIVRLQNIPGPRDEGQSLMVHVIDPTQSGPGQLAFIAACTTGAARDYLSEFACSLKTLKTEAGTSVHPCYGDTDSIALPTPDFSTPEAQAWRDKYLHLTRLGAWKLERRFDAALFINRKVYCGHFETAGVTLSDDRLHEELLTRPEKEFYVKAKGLRKKTVNYRDMSAVMEGGVVVKSMGLVFKSTYEKGIVKDLQLTRSMRLVNSTLQPADEEGFLHPFSTLEDFEIALASRD